VILWNRDVILWNHDVILVFAARFPDFSALLAIVFLPCPLLLSGSSSESSSLTSL
jgi:hypothetical protein